MSDEVNASSALVEGEEKMVNANDLDISDYIMVNLIHEDRADTFLCPVDKVDFGEELPPNRNFSIHMNEYYNGNVGLELLKAGNEEQYKAWAKTQPESAALISIVWQVEHKEPFAAPEWWPYKPKEFHTQVVRPGLIYTTYMVRLIINIDVKPPTTTK